MTLALLILLHAHFSSFPLLSEQSLLSFFPLVQLLKLVLSVINLAIMFSMSSLETNLLF